MSDLPENCPKCDTKWSKTPKIMGGGFWIHCKPCNKKAEDIMKEQKDSKKTNPVNNNWTYTGGSYYGTTPPKIGDKKDGGPQGSTDDIFEELEKMIADWDDDIFITDRYRGKPEFAL